MAELSIGCSGFSYRHWRGNFYPEGVPTKDWFKHYMSVFSTVELNVTFYRTPNATVFQHWYQESAPGFSFAVKGSRYITHVKRLVDVEESVGRFFTPVLELKEKLQVVLWQFPPQFKANPERLKSFLDLLAPYQLRNTLEFRNESWLTPEIVKICKARSVGICMADWPPFVDETPITSDFVYLRRHGQQGSYNGYYSADQIENDARRIKKYLGDALDVFIYYNNDAGGAAPKNAVELGSVMENVYHVAPHRSGY